MATLELIRHGQASFGADDYDVLSDVGIQQARLLGEHYAAVGRRCDAFYSGPRRRQRDTAQHLADAARANGLALPPLQIVDELDEYPAFEIAKHCLPALLDGDPEFQAIAAADPQREWRVFETMLLRWLDGRLDCGPFETYRDFQTRVLRGLQRIMESQSKGRIVVAVTSGGPISIAMAAALDLGSKAIMKVQSATYNASVSQLKFRGAEWKLAAFNGVPHLVGKAPLTLR